MLLSDDWSAGYEAYKQSITAFNSMITTAHNLGTQICSYVDQSHTREEDCGLRQLLRLCVLMCITIKLHIKQDPAEADRTQAANEELELVHSKEVMAHSLS